MITPPVDYTERGFSILFLLILSFGVYYSEDIRFFFLIGFALIAFVLVMAGIAYLIGFSTTYVWRRVFK